MEASFIRACVPDMEASFIRVVVPGPPVPSARPPGYLVGYHRRSHEPGPTHRPRRRHTVHQVRAAHPELRHHVMRRETRRAEPPTRAHHRREERPLQ